MAERRCRRSKTKNSRKDVSSWPVMNGAPDWTTLEPLVQNIKVLKNSPVVSYSYRHIKKAMSYPITL